MGKGIESLPGDRPTHHVLKLLILGGTGRLGKELLVEAIKREHTVHALVRDTDRLPFHSDKLVPFKGNPNNREDLSIAIRSCHAVLSALNISRTSDFPWSKLRTPKDFLSQTIENLIILADENLIERVIICSAWGVGDSRKEIPFWFRWLIANSNIGPAYEGHEAQEERLKASQLKWTAVRPVGLTQATQAKVVLVSSQGHPKPNLTISRRNVARFMLDILEQERFVGQTPTIFE